MKNYEIAKDIQDLKLRVERIEHIYQTNSGNLEFEREGLRVDCGDLTSGKRSNLVGRVLLDSIAGIDFDQDPILWKLEEKASLPPFAASLIGYPPNVLFDIAPQSKTWTCVPEPLIVEVNWDDGTKDEHFRFSDQVFSIIKVTDPNTGKVTATAIYSARLISRNGRSIDYAGGYIGPPYVPAYYAGPAFYVTLRGTGGAGLSKYFSNFSVGCRTNTTVNFSSDFPPGLYDLVTGATWEMSNWRVQRC